MGTLQSNKKEQTTNICNNLDLKSVSPRKISSTKKRVAYFIILFIEPS